MFGIHVVGAGIFDAYIMSNRNSNFSWTKLLLFKVATEKPSENSAGPIIFAVILLGIFILKLPWWICVIIIVITVFNSAKNKNHRQE